MAAYCKTRIHKITKINVKTGLKLYNLLLNISHFKTNILNIKMTILCFKMYEFLVLFIVNCYNVTNIYKVFVVVFWVHSNIYRAWRLNALQAKNTDVRVEYFTLLKFYENKTNWLCNCYRIMLTKTSWNIVYCPIMHIKSLKLCIIFYCDFF